MKRRTFSSRSFVFDIEEDEERTFGTGKTDKMKKARESGRIGTVGRKGEQ